MCSAFLRVSAVLLVLCGADAANARELRVCADPNNLPFSNEAEQGFENKIVRIVAGQLGAKLTYVWWAQRRGMISEGLNGGECDLIPGVASIAGVLLTYPPYYRSIYSFVTRPDELAVQSLDDPRLREVKVGVELIGDDGNNTPPAMALARRGIVNNVRGFSVAGDYSQSNPPARIIDAVRDGTIDVAVAWGPLAGYFAQHEPTRLVVTPVAAQYDADLPMAFDVSMALRLDEGALRKDVEAALEAKKLVIGTVLAAYGVPRLDGDAL